MTYCRLVHLTAILAGISDLIHETSQGCHERPGCGELGGVEELLAAVADEVEAGLEEPLKEVVEVGTVLLVQRLWQLVLHV